MTRYRLSPNWKIERRNESLIISGGADEVFAADDIDEHFFKLLSSGKYFNKARVDNQAAFEQLLTYGVIIPELKRKDADKGIKIYICGDQDLGLKDRNRLHFVNEDHADMLLIVRAHSSYAKILEKIDYANIHKPHLLIDLAFHHTISVGPLVFPTETACLACLRGRIDRFWGDPEPPENPATNRYQELIREMIYVELDKIANGDIGLVNQTISFNLANYQINHNLLLKVPTCKMCDTGIL